MSTKYKYKQLTQKDYFDIENDIPFSRQRYIFLAFYVWILQEQLLQPRVKPTHDIHILSKGEKTACAHLINTSCYEVWHKLLKSLIAHLP